MQNGVRCKTFTKAKRATRAMRNGGRGLQFKCADAKNKRGSFSQEGYPLAFEKTNASLALIKGRC